MTNSKHFSLLAPPIALLTLVLAAPTAWAQESPPAPSAEGVAEPAETAPAAAPSGSTATRPEPAPPPVSIPAAQPVVAISTDEPFRRALRETSGEVRLRRMSEASLGVVAGGALIGTGFVAQGDDMTASHWLWVSGGVVAAGSLAALFIPTELECLASQIGEKSDAELRAEWKKMAESSKVERRAGAVFGGALGTASVIVGGLVLDDQIDDMTDDTDKILGTALIAGGGLTIGQAVVEWIVPSAIERGYARLDADPTPTMAFSAAPTAGGASVSLSGKF